MATKKQKRTIAEAKHQAFMNEIRETGLAALAKDREHRERKNREAWLDNHQKKHSWKNRIKECPHCSDILRAAEWSARKIARAAIPDSKKELKR